MKRTFGLAAVIATLLLVSGCSGLHGKDRPARDPVRLPSAPALEGSPTTPAIRHDRLESRAYRRHGRSGRIDLLKIRHPPSESRGSGLAGKEMVRNQPLRGSSARIRSRATSPGIAADFFRRFPAA